MFFRPNPRAITVHYMRWARLDSIVYTWPQTLEVLRLGVQKLQLGPYHMTRQYEMMEAALWAGDPRQGPPVTRMVCGEARQRRLALLRDAYPAPRR